MRPSLWRIRIRQQRLNSECPLTPSTFPGKKEELLITVNPNRWYPCFFLDYVFLRWTALGVLGVHCADEVSSDCKGIVIHRVPLSLHDPGKALAFLEFLSPLDLTWPQLQLGLYFHSLSTQFSFRSPRSSFLPIDLFLFLPLLWLLHNPLTISLFHFHFLLFLFFSGWPEEIRLQGFGSVPPTLSWLSFFWRGRFGARKFLAE